MIIKTEKKPSIVWFVPKRRMSPIISKFNPDYCWHPAKSLASVWIRGYQIGRHLRERGFDVYCNAIDRTPQVAVFLRRYGAEDVELARRLKAKRVKIVLDLVVDYFSVRDGTAEGVGKSSVSQVENMRALLAIADEVWTVSPFLQMQARKYNSNVHFVTDSVDECLFNPNQRKSSRNTRPLAIGWSGVSKKASQLNMISNVIRPIIEKGDIRVIVISNKKPQLNFPFEFKRWSYNRFPVDVAECDLCVAPREVTCDYNRGHSIYKIGVFMAAGVPAITSNVPSYELLLQDGQSGAICKTLDDWHYQLNRFVEKQEVRKSWSDACIRKMKPFMTSYTAEKIDRLLRSLLGYISEKNTKSLT